MLADMSRAQQLNSLKLYVPHSLVSYFLSDILISQYLQDLNSSQSLNPMSACLFETLIS